MADNKRQIFTTPKLRFSYPKLVVADTKFKPEGEYSVKGIGSADDPAVQKLIALIDKAAAESLANAKGKAKTPVEAKKWQTKYLPYNPVLDQETGEETGEIEFKFSSKASGVSAKTGKPWTRKISLFDAKGKPIKDPDIKIGGGTIGKISFLIQPYAQTPQTGASVKLALEAAQIIELHSYSGASADSYGFSEEEGFDYEEGDDEGSSYDSYDNADDTEGADF